MMSSAGALSLHALKVSVVMGYAAVLERKRQQQGLGDLLAGYRGDPVRFITEGLRLCTEPSWSSWLIVLRAAYGQGSTFDAEELRFFKSISGGRNPPKRRVKQLWLIVGRRGGKDSIASLIAVNAARFADCVALRPGERALIPCFATDRDQAGIVFSYIRGYFEEIPRLQGWLANDLPRSYRSGPIELQNRTDIQVVTNNFRAPRGRPIATTIFDECLVAGTLIWTNYGNKPIEQVKPGDMVLTRVGLKPVIESRRTNTNAELWEVRLSNGASVVGTANHPVYTEAGFIPLAKLCRGDKCRSLFGTTGDGISIRNQGTILTGRENYSTVKSICGSTVSYLQKFTSTTATKISTGQWLGGIITEKEVSVEHVSCLTTRGPVYNFEVEGCPEYFANGVLVHNCAFWRDENSANPDVETYRAVLPGMATVPDSMLVGISSPHKRSGLLFNKYDTLFGKDDDNELVIQAPTRVMNPKIDEINPGLIDEAMADDPELALAEYFAEFRRDLADYVQREVVDACTPKGIMRIEPLSNTEYYAFVDPSGGSADSMTLAIAHREGDRGILDAVFERRAPFAPSEVVLEFCKALEPYQVTVVKGDRYAGEWPREQFAQHGVQYDPSEESKSEIYRDFLPMLNSTRCQLLDINRLKNQLLGLERRTVRGGRDSIDHAPGALDDIINSAAGVLLMAAGDEREAVVSRYLDAHR